MLKQLFCRHKYEYYTNELGQLVKICYKCDKIIPKQKEGTILTYTGEYDDK